ncbi:hypothetical protein FB45DRAFT_940505 [Roridomyces roridus]|uniref:Uncharacterized protein n=1 Tax=Roridomyces roridus TaxID=1738132 RepID=A0AAD7B5T6_9AGAR|nr:hypothetical protein FB45DRAFT_940505 [Roridomyces roridus]
MANPTDHESTGRFVDLLFEHIFFTADNMPLVLSTYENDVAADAEIEINGKKTTVAEFLDIIKQMHAGFIPKLTNVENLAERPGVVARVLRFTLTSKVDGTISEYASATIVKVEERNGRRVLTGFVEVEK